MPRQFLSDTLGSGQTHNVPVVPFRVCELTSMTRASASCQKVSYVAGSSSSLVAVTLFCLHFYFLLHRTSQAGRLFACFVLVLLSFCRFFLLLHLMRYMCAMAGQHLFTLAGESEGETVNTQSRRQRISSFFFSDELNTCCNNYFI